MIRQRKINKMPREGDLRVWNIINPPDRPIVYPVTDPKHGAQLIEALANSQLLDKSIDSNAFGLEIFENGEWLEWESEDGEDITEWTENINNMLNIKDLVKDKKVKFLFYRARELWYEVEGTNFRFSVDINDTGDAAFLPEDKAIIFMRYIRKSLEAQEKEQYLQKTI
jgi:hypothetical protein